MSISGAEEARLALIFEERRREREDSARAEGFADCESLIAAMVSAMAGRELSKAALALHDDNPTTAKHHKDRSGALREVVLAVSLGQHRTDAYDQDTITNAHQRAATAGLRRRGGRNRAAALSPERRREIAVTASNAARAARERAKKGNEMSNRLAKLYKNLEVEGFSVQNLESILANSISFQGEIFNASLLRRDLSELLGILFARVERLERLATHGRQGIPLGELRPPFDQLSGFGIER